MNGAILRATQTFQALNLIFLQLEKDAQHSPSVPAYKSRYVHRRHISRKAKQTPVYGDFVEPTPAPGENRVRGLGRRPQPILRGRASGGHSSVSDPFPFVVVERLVAEGQRQALRAALSFSRLAAAQRAARADPYMPG
jgi:hypothetical protein